MLLCLEVNLSESELCFGALLRHMYIFCTVHVHVSTFAFLATGCANSWLSIHKSSCVSSLC